VKIWGMIDDDELRSKSVTDWMVEAVRVYIYVYDSCSRNDVVVVVTLSCLVLLQQVESSVYIFVL